MTNFIKQTIVGIETVSTIEIGGIFETVIFSARKPTRGPFIVVGRKNAIRSHNGMVRRRIAKLPRPYVLTYSMRFDGSEVGRVDGFSDRPFYLSNQQVDFDRPQPHIQHSEQVDATLVSAHSA